MSSPAPRRRSRSLQEWLSESSPQQQLWYGCIGVVVAGAAVLYCAGLASLFARPILLNRATPTDFLPPTLVATPTQAPPTFINLPPGTLLSTPTQAPIPTREPPTVTPTADLTNPAPTLPVTPTNPAPRVTPTSSPRASATPTRRVTATQTPRP